jgi:hypothetical protein
MLDGSAPLGDLVEGDDADLAALVHEVKVEDAAHLARFALVRLQLALQRARCQLAAKPR